MAIPVKSIRSGHFFFTFGLRTTQPLENYYSRVSFLVYINCEQCFVANLFCQDSSSCAVAINSIAAIIT